MKAALLLCLPALLCAQPRQADVIVYGATSAGIAAAIQVARMGKSVLVLDPGTHIGGLTTGGLSWTDIGNKQVVGGIAREFYRRIKTKYDDPKAWVWETRDHYYTARRSANTAGEDAMWTFEPKIALQVYREMLGEHKVRIVPKPGATCGPAKASSCAAIAFSRSSWKAAPATSAACSSTPPTKAT